MQDEKDEREFALAETERSIDRWKRVNLILIGVLCLMAAFAGALWFAGAPVTDAIVGPFIEAGAD